MKLRLYTPAFASSTIIDASDSVRSAVTAQREFTKPEAEELATKPASLGVFGRLLLRLLADGSESVYVSVISNNPDRGAVNGILDEMEDEQTSESATEAEPNLEDVIDPDTEDFC